MRVEALAGAALEAVLDDVARLRTTVFRDWPYLHDGDLAYERAYLAPYRDNPRAVLAGAFDGDILVGAATGTPMEDHADDLGAAFATVGPPLSDIFYCAESVLLSDFRGKGVGHRFFDIREAKARELGHAHIAFCAVMRPEDHPARPPEYRPLDAFWRARGYAVLPGAIARFAWKDRGAATETEKPMQFWIRSLP